MVLSKTWNGTTYSIPQSGERGWATLTNFLSALADGAQSTGKQLIGRRVATTSPVTVTATTDAYVGVNVSGAVAAVSLPAGVAGQVFYITDESGAAVTYNITVTPNGAETIGGAATYVLNANNQAIGIVYSGTDWKLFANFTPVAVTSSSSTTFTNKKLTDSSVTFVDDGDTTKQLAFQCSGITTGTTRTWTVPNSSDTMVGKATTDTFTNKTLNGNTATNLISGSGTLTLNTAGTATVQSVTGTLQTKSQTDVATTATINGMASGQSVSMFTGSTATTVNGITAGYLGQILTVTNNSSAAITFTHDNGSAAVGARIVLPSYSSFILPAASSSLPTATFVYATNGGSNYWHLINTNISSQILGSRSGVAPVAGALGEQLKSAVGATSAPTSTQYGDLTSISLTPGIWDISALINVSLNGAVWTQAAGGISTTSGNSGTGLVSGDTFFGILPPTSASDNGGAIPCVRASLSATTTYYLKMYATYSSGTPKFYGRLTATRVG